MGGSSGKQLWQPIRQPPEKTAIVTGGNTGLGFEIAKHLALMGCRVILACRSEARAKAATIRMQADLIEYKAASELPYGYRHEDLPEELNVEFMPLDLTSLTSVMQFVTAYKASGYPLHILICNAGIAFVAQSYTEDGYESQFQVNYLSHFLMTLYLIPLMRESDEECRIINVSSIASRDGKLDLKNIQGRKNYSRRHMYSNSKLFQIMNMFSLERRFKGSKITVNCMHPGAVVTEISRGFQDDSFWKKAFNMSKSVGYFKTDVLMGAAGAINAAVNPSLEGISGMYYEKCYPVSPPANARDVKQQEVLWRYSLECLQDHVVPQILEDFTCDLKELGVD